MRRSRVRSPSTPPNSASGEKETGRFRGPFASATPEIYFDEPEELAPEPLPEPMPVEPAPVEPEPVVSLLPVLGAPLPIALPLVLGEALEPPVALEPVELLPCSRRQRSFSVPVMASHRVLLPTLGEVDGEVVEGSEDEPDEPDAPVVPLAEESVLLDPPTLCDDD